MPERLRQEEPAHEIDGAEVDVKNMTILRKLFAYNGMKVKDQQDGVVYEMPCLRREANRKLRTCSSPQDFARHDVRRATTSWPGLLVDLRSRSLSCRRCRRMATPQVSIRCL